MTDRNSENELVEQHWQIDWAEQGVARNLLPWWLLFLWVVFLLWGVAYIVDSSAAW
jgi:hypothetical protein